MLSLYLPLISSYSNRSGKGLKISWGKDENVGLLERWNPLSSRIPYTIFTSHVLMQRGRVNNPQMKLDTLVTELERAVQAFQRANASRQPSGEGGEAVVEEFKVKTEEIVIDTYLGVSALIHNQSHLGFNKRRGAVDW